ncbi:MAG: carboxypeptidase regulatory-like domain-containing protein, partial [Bacteroidota bacterium]
MKIKPILIFLLFLSAMQVHAQINVQGIVADEEGEALTGVTVSLTQNGEVAGDITDANGRFSIVLQNAG